MKKISTIIMLLLVFIFTSSCNENEIDLDEYTDIKPNSIKIENTLYNLQKDGTLKKYEENNFSYSINVSNDIKGIIDFDLKKYQSKNNGLRIFNNKTDEFIDIINIVQNDLYIQFDAITSLGLVVKGIKYYPEDLNTLSYIRNVPPWVWPVVEILVGAIIDISSATSIEQCIEAMQSIICPSGSSVFMDYKESWFSTSCSVGCR